MIEEVKENVRECGGRTHLCTVDYDGKLEILTKIAIESRVQKIKEAETIVRQIAAGTIENGEVTDAFSAWLDGRIKRLKELKGALISLPVLLAAAISYPAVIFQIKCHTMPSNLRCISLKTKHRSTN